MYIQAYQQMRAKMKKLEATELTSFGFILHVEQPHKLMISFLHYLEASNELMQESCNLCNDRYAHIYTSFVRHVCGVPFVLSALAYCCFHEVVTPSLYLCGTEREG